MNEPGDVVISGRVVSEATATPISVSTDGTAGSFHFCAITDSSQLYCWGSNEFGQVGAAGFGAWGAKKIAAFRVPGFDGLVPLSVAAGAEHTCAHFQGDVVKCWGRNNSGQLGGGNFSARQATPVDVTGL